MNTTSSSLIRPLSGVIAATFIAATVLLLGLGFDLFVKPPDLPSSNDLVQNLLGRIDFQHAVWPFDLTLNLLFAVGLVSLVPFGRAIGALVSPEDPRTTLFVWAFIVAGILGTAAELIYIGAKQTTIDNAYCDCGYKAQESISQFWALMLIQGVQSWLINGVAVLLAIGVGLSGAVLANRAMPWAWGALSWITAAVLVASLVLSLGHVADPVGPVVQALATGILFPAWAVWLGARFGDRAAAPTGATLPDTEPVDIE
jgi:hypothetical protein